MLGIIKALLILCFNWIAGNAIAKVYTSSGPIGKRIGGHDDPRLRDWYIIIDIRAGGKVLLLGYFQTS